MQDYEHYDHPTDRQWDGRRRQPVPDALPQRTHKDRRRWCAGHVGREHQVEIAVKEWSGSRLSCGPVRTTIAYPSGTRVEQITWHCFEREHCTVCGRWLGYLRRCTYRSDTDPPQGRR